MLTNGFETNFVKNLSNIYIIYKIIFNIFLIRINSKNFFLFKLIENDIQMYAVETVCYKYKTKCLNLHFIIKVDFEEDLFD